MSEGYLTALALFAGSLIGALGMLGTSWSSQRSQERAERLARTMSKRQQLYEDFIEEASKLYADAMAHDLGEPSKLVHLYALLSRLRLSAPGHVVANADEILRRILALYQTPRKNFDISQALQRPDDLDLLRSFSDACRDDLHHGAGGPHKGAGHATTAHTTSSATSGPVTTARHEFSAKSPPSGNGPS